MQAAHDPKYRTTRVDFEDKKQPQVIFVAPEAYESPEEWERAHADDWFD